MHEYENVKFLACIAVPQLGEAVVTEQDELKHLCLETM